MATTGNRQRCPPTSLGSSRGHRQWSGSWAPLNQHFFVVTVRGRNPCEMDQRPKDISYTHYINRPGPAEYLSQVFVFALVLSSAGPNSV